MCSFSTPSRVPFFNSGAACLGTHFFRNNSDRWLAVRSDRRARPKPALVGRRSFYAKTGNTEWRRLPCKERCAKSMPTFIRCLPLAATEVTRTLSTSPPLAASLLGLRLPSIFLERHSFIIKLATPLKGSLSRRRRLPMDGGAVFFFIKYRSTRRRPQSARPLPDFPTSSPRPSLRNRRSDPLCEAFFYKKTIGRLRAVPAELPSKSGRR